MNNIDELNKLLIESEFDVTKDIVKYIFGKIEAATQEEMNIKATLLKQSFLNKFELEFEMEFLDASQSL
jgi:hypothetical protein